MTAEVAVMSSIGVALAADSAVSVGAPGGKIYSSAEKLFRLSESAPVGAMVYGNASFVGVPWETVIKSYRRHLGERRFDTVREYAEDLISWLSSSVDLFPDDARDKQMLFLVGLYFRYLRKEFEQRVDRAAREKDGLEEEDLPSLLDEVVKHHLSHIRKSPLLEEFSKSFQKDLRREYRSGFSKLKRRAFGELPFRSSTKRLLTTIAVELLSRHHFSPLQCGLVIAGFGEMQYMPALVCYELDEMVGSKVREAVTGDHAITGPGEAVIVPFAQKDMVCAFMEGIDSDLSVFMQESTSELFFGLFTSMLDLVRQCDDALADQLEEIVGPNVGELISALFIEWREWREKYWGPVLDVVSALPKDELAEMAGALVNLTKFRRRVTTVPETVGGPVDVAVITKGDGFVWVKRKHYFDASLNPRFMARHYKGGHHDGRQGETAFSKRQRSS